MINILGLSAGIACCLIIYLLVRYEYSFDSFHKYYNDIYLVINDSTKNDWDQNSNIDFRIASYLKDRYPDVTSSCSMLAGQVELRNDQDYFSVNLVMTDSGFFNVFTFPLIKGNVTKALEKGKIILTSDLAEKIFHSTDVLGKSVEIGNQEFIISGIAENVPPNSSIRFEVLTVHNNELFFNRSCGNDKCIYPKNVFIRLQSNDDPDAFLSRITNPVELDEGFKTYLGLEPLRDLYFWKDNSIATFEKGNLKMISVFSFIAFIVLLLAVINYINLSVSRMMNRVRESGVKKTIGANYFNLIEQIVFESVLLAAMSFVIAMVLTALTIPRINMIYEKHIHFLSLFKFPDLLIWILGPAIIGLLTGIYPAVVFARRSAIAMINKSSGKMLRKNPFVKILPAFQFSSSLILIITLIIIYKQIQFVKHVNLGFDKDHLMWIGLPFNQNSAITGFVNKINHQQGVAGSSLSLGGPGRIFMRVSNDDTEGKTVDQINIDTSFLKVFNISIVKGREMLPGDLGKVAYINETAMKLLNWDTLDGKKYEGKEVIGVVSDFHVNSLYKMIDPVVLVFDSSNLISLNVKMTGKNIPATLEFIRDQWKYFFPYTQFHYSFFNEFFDHMYRKEEKLSKLVSGFSVLAIFISCLGMIGMIEFSTRRRVKEIGIRKVVGASSGDIIFLLLKNYLLAIILSMIIAFPLGYYAGSRWLMSFAYKTEISWWIFVMAGFLAVLITFLSISYQTIKAAVSNPVEALKYE